MEYKVGDKVRIKSLDWYNENKDKDGNVPLIDNTNSKYNFIKIMQRFCGKVMTISSANVYSYNMVEDIDNYFWTDEMIEGLVEEETPKFKIDDIVFVKNIGWVRITNRYWDSLANEYIYEAIGFNGEGEYDSINHSNIECQMLPESENPHTCGNKITLDEYKNNDKEWLLNKLAMLDNITALESIQDIFNHLQQSKYPKTYEECCEVLGLNIVCSELLFYYPLNCGDYTTFRLPEMEKFEKFIQLYLCRNAYWKIYGEENGLGKPWEPDYSGTFEHGSPIKYVIYNNGTYIVKERKSSPNHILSFPTEEMRDAFYEAFKELIEECKEFL